jgi:hypothetical protein
LSSSDTIGESRHCGRPALPRESHGGPALRRIGRLITELKAGFDLDRLAFHLVGLERPLGRGILDVPLITGQDPDDMDVFHLAILTDGPSAPRIIARPVRLLWGMACKQKIGP